MIDQKSGQQQEASFALRVDAMVSSTVDRAANPRRKTGDVRMRQYFYINGVG
jgi:hypothetical protein